LVSDDAGSRDAVAAEFRAGGCSVFCVRDLDEAAALVRAGLTRRFVLIRLEDEVVPASVLRAEMSARLPGWKVEPDELEDDYGREPRTSSSSTRAN
jgi:hypothetical protein